MSNSSGDTILQVDSRPVGFVKPNHERAVLALAAIESDRLADAEKHIAAIPESVIVDRAWKILLHGLIAVEQADSANAEVLLLEAFSLAFVAGWGREETLDPESLRLGACALHHVGRLYRRRDCPEDAYKVHLAAYDLHERYGSFDELWETAIELGLDADVARRYDDARRWYRIAIEIAGKTSDEPARKQAIAWTYLSTSLTDDGRHDEAVAAAREARDCWREHDITAVTAAQADLKLGRTLLAQGESLHECGDRLAKPILDEAIKWLATAREALLAFGPEYAADARLCLEQQDFAERLIASLAV